MSNHLSVESPTGRVLLAWWESLEDDRASRAILRRAETITAVALTAPYQRLYRKLRETGWNPEDRAYLGDRLAAAVGLLAHVRENGDLAPAKAMSARREGSDKPAVSENRFMRLLESPDLDALFLGLRRVLPLINHRVHILALADQILNWGDDMKKTWAYAYDWPAKAAA